MMNLPKVKYSSISLASNLSIWLTHSKNYLSCSTCALSDLRHLTTSLIDDMDLGRAASGDNDNQFSLREV